MAPRRGGGSNGGDGSGGSSFKNVGSDHFVPYRENLTMLVIMAVALAGMLPLVIAMFKIKTKKTQYNLNRTGFKSLKYAILLLTLYVFPLPSLNYIKQLRRV